MSVKCMQLIKCRYLYKFVALHNQLIASNFKMISATANDDIGENSFRNLIFKPPIISSLWCTDDDTFLKYAEQTIVKLSQFHQYYANEDIHSTIPKILHFVWLGSLLPQSCQKIIDSWSKYHPLWTICIWGNSDERNVSIIHI